MIGYQREPGLLIVPALLCVLSPYGVFGRRGIGRSGLYDVTSPFPRFTTYRTGGERGPMGIM
jgi:hypothetical protein